LKSDELLSAALFFDVETLKRDPEGADFVRLLQLFPGSLRPDKIRGRSAIKVASRGLAAELNGDRDRAALEYRALSGRRGLAGLLGALLTAWQADAAEADFDRAIAKVPAADDALMASVHCRLMSWAIDRGWRERASGHFKSARQLAQGDLAEVLARSGDWFDTSVEVRWGHRFTDPLVVCETAVAAMKEAADESLQRTFEDSVRSPWTRVIRFGGEVAGMRSVVAAEVQASWVGAIWLLPAIRQQYAKIALPDQAEPEEVGRAIGSWIRGGGKEIPKVIEAFEGRLTPSALSKLVYEHLHEGRSVKRRSDWIATCHALWDQLPESLCLSLISTYEPIVPAAQHDGRTEEAALFASLVMRAPSAWGDFVCGMSAEQLSTIVRSLHPTLVKFVPENTLSRCITAFLDSQGAFGPDWSDHGWVTVAVMWKRLPSPSKKIAQELRQSIPEAQAASVALNAEELVSRHQLISARDAAIERLETDLSNARKGTFVHWGQSPAPQLARACLALGRVTKRSIDILTKTANAIECSSEQRHASLRALTALIEERVVRISIREVRSEPPTAGGHPFQDSLADIRLERIARIGLRVRLSAAQDRTGELLEATRDADARVRQTALNTATWMMAKRPERAAALETAVFGGLYDPTPNVQSVAAEGIARYGLHDASLEAVATKRIEATFSLMHRDVRAAVARALADRGREDGVYGRIRALARDDRSFVVRYSEAQPSA